MAPDRTSRELPHRNNLLIPKVGLYRLIRYVMSGGGGIVVLRLITRLARVAFGFALASIAAGLVTVMFVDMPVDVLAQPASRLPQTASQTLDLALLTATHSGLFAAAFVLIAAGLGEWLSIRSLPFYLIAGMGIALLGFIAQFRAKSPGNRRYSIFMR